MTVLRFLFAFFALVGAADKLIGNKFKLGERFEKGILMAGTVALAIAGMICIAPTLASLLIPVFTPFAQWTGIDPSFIGAFIANDMGGASVAQELASSALIGGYNGLVVASMMGVTITFTIPAALKMIDSVYHKDVLTGILCGVATIPIGCIVSGFMLQIPFGAMLLNLLPVLAVAIATCIGLVFAPSVCTKVFSCIGSVVSAVIMIGLAGAVFEHITGIALIPGMAPASEAMAISGDIAIILSGAFPMIAVVERLFGKLFALMGKCLGVNESAVLGFISSLVNSVPTFEMTDKMDPKGRILNLAFAVSASFVFGDHLAFTMAFDEYFTASMIVGKLVSGVCAVYAAHVLYNLSSQNKTSVDISKS